MDIIAHIFRTKDRNAQQHMTNILRAYLRGNQENAGSTIGILPQKSDSPEGCIFARAWVRGRETSPGAAQSINLAAEEPHKSYPIRRFLGDCVLSARKHRATQPQSLFCRSTTRLSDDAAQTSWDCGVPHYPRDHLSIVFMSEELHCGLVIQRNK